MSAGTVEGGSAGVPLIVPPGVPWDDGRWACAALRAAGHEAWLVGGCVRDLLLGRAVHDVDVATSAHPEQVAACFARTLEVGKAFGVMIALHPSGRQIEIATFRTDGLYVDGRRPSTVQFATAHQDVQRRDFTINALLLDPLSGVVVDHVGGRADLAAKLIRVIAGPERLTEDRLRVLRALRFAAHLACTIEPATWQAVQTTSLHGLARERIWQEIDKGLAHAPMAWLRLVAAAGKSAEVFPPLASRSDQAPVLPRELDLPGDLHPDAYITRLFDGIPDTILYPWLDREPLPRQRSERFRWLRSAAVTLCAQPNLPTRRRLMRHPDAPVLVSYLIARKELPESVEWLASEQADTVEPLVRASDLLALGVTPGPQIGVWLRQIEDAQLAHEIATRTEALELARRLAGR